MPRLSVWFIRSSLVYLGLGFTFGGLLLFHKGIPLHPLLWRLLPAHIEFVLWGWITQLIMGVAYWILPRLSHPPKRGNPTLNWGAFWLLNLSIWANVLALFISGIGWIKIIASMAKLIGILSFVSQAWPRIRSVRYSQKS